MTDEATTRRLADLDRREAELLDRLQRCIPPVDQHRHELQRIRTERDELRGLGS